MTDDAEPFHVTFAREQLGRDLDSLFRAVLPHQWVRLAVEAVLATGSPLVTPMAHSAAVKREADWQHHWIAKHQAAEIEASRLRQQLDVTALDRTRAVVTLLGELRPSKSAKHDDACHERHAACLAAKIRAALFAPEA